MKMSIVQKRWSDTPRKWGIWEEEEEKQSTHSQHGGAHKQERTHKPEHIRIIIMEYLRALYRELRVKSLLNALFTRWRSVRFESPLLCQSALSPQNNANSNKTKQEILKSNEIQKNYNKKHTYIRIMLPPFRDEWLGRLRLRWRRQWQR